VRDESGVKASDSSATAVVAAAGAPMVDVEIIADGVALLRLDYPLPFGDCMSFKFPLLPVARDQVELFESPLRDSQEEVNALKADVAALRQDNAAVKADDAALKDDIPVLKFQISPQLISLRQSVVCANNDRDLQSSSSS
jgi:hypothetical protein